MRIAIDVRSLMEGRLSGVQEYTTQITRALLRIGLQHEYHLFYNSLRSVTLPDFGGAVHVHWFRYPNKVFNFVQFASDQPRWNALVPADVYFMPHARLMPLATTTPLVVTAHDLSYERFPEFYSWQRRVWHRLVRARLTMQNADHVIAVSHATADDVVMLYGVDPGRVSVVYSGVAHRSEYPVAQTLITSLTVNKVKLT